MHHRSVLIAVTLLLCGCQGAPAPVHAARVVPKDKADLPPAPDLNPPQPPDRHPDGAYSVRGLFAAPRKELPAEVLVRGTIATLHPCALTEKICKPAPYLYLTDTKTGQGRRLLVGGERDLDGRKLLVGQEVVLRGAFATGSDDGTYFAPQGMLLLTPLPPVEPAAGGPDAR